MEAWSPVQRFTLDMLSYYEQCKAAGLCTHGCGKSARTGKTECVECAEKNTIRLRAYRADKRSRGECSFSVCHEPVINGAFCEAHAEQQSVRHKARNDDKRSRGECYEVTCREPAVRGGRCDTHAKKKAIEKMERAADKRRRGECRHCIDAVAAPGGIYCTKHFFAVKTQTCETTVEDLVVLWEVQGGRCRYTGVVLLHDDSTELDHVIPRSKGGTGDVSNLAWASRDFNQMKRDFTIEELEHQCRLFLTLRDAEL